MEVQTDGVGSIEEAVDVGESKCIKGGWLAVATLDMVLLKILE